MEWQITLILIEWNSLFFMIPPLHCYYIQTPYVHLSFEINLILFLFILQPTISHHQFHFIIFTYTYVFV